MPILNSKAREGRYRTSITMILTSFNSFLESLHAVDSKDPTSANEPADVTMKRRLAEETRTFFNNMRNDNDEHDVLDAVIRSESRELQQPVS